MPRTFGALYPQIYNWENLLKAFKQASKTKRFNHEVMTYKYNLEANLIDLQNRLIWQMWKPSPYRHFVIFEPKRREIAAPVFSDRVLHHAINRIIEPLFERRFLPCSFACRKGYGTHKAVELAQRYIKEASNKYKHPYIFKGDMKSYFASIPHEYLKNQIRRVIRCPDTLGILDLIIDHGSSNGFGLPIGALLSQLFANVTLDPMDHYAKETLGMKRYVRLMDDFIAVCGDKSEARNAFWELETYSEFKIGLKLNHKSCVLPVAHGLDFCGYRIWPGYRLPRKRNVRRMRKRLRKMVNLYKKQKCTSEAICQSWQSFLGYMKHCKSHDTVVGIYEDLQKQLKGD